MKHTQAGEMLHRRRLIYWLADLISVSLGWFGFNIIRFFSLPSALDITPGEWLLYPQVILGQLVVPLMMTGLFAFCGYYGRRSLLQRTRGDVVITSFCTTFFGMLIIFFITLINDGVPERLLNYELMLILWMCLFVPVTLTRYYLTMRLRKAQAQGRFNIPTLLIGTPEECDIMRQTLVSQHHPMGLKPIASCEFEKISIMKNLDRYAAVVICFRTKDSNRLALAVNEFYDLEVPVFVNAINYSILELRPRFETVAGEALVDVSASPTHPFVANCKRTTDIILSSFALVLLSPLLLTLAWMVKRDSPGPVIYSQTRVGFHRREFRIYKFRSMYTDAEADGRPHLSSPNDPRVTTLGQVLRKYRLDELPQFWNVLKGDMSLVGPRPERAYFGSQLLGLAPKYALIYQAMPGLTSLGSVKFGYASNIDQMLRRMEYDLIYIQNISLRMDIKVLFYTIITVFSGRGV